MSTIIGSDPKSPKVCFVDDLPVDRLS